MRIHPPTLLRLPPILNQLRRRLAEEFGLCMDDIENLPPLHGFCKEESQVVALDQAEDRLTASPHIPPLRDKNRGLRHGTMEAIPVHELEVGRSRKAKEMLTN